MVREAASGLSGPAVTAGVGRRRFIAYAGSLAATVCTPGTVRAEAVDNAVPLPVGFVGPFSGPAAATGQDIRQGVTMALEDATAEGELPLRIEGRRRTIEPVWLDSASDPDIAAATVGEALQSGRVNMLVGGWHSAVALSLMDVEAPYRVLHLGHLGAAEGVAEKINAEPDKYRGWFKGWPTPTKLVAQHREPLDHFLRRGLWQPGGRTAAIVVEETAWGHSWGNAMRTTLQALGFETLPIDLTGLDQADFRPLLLKYRQAGVSVVATTNTGNRAEASFVRQFHEIGIRALLVADGLRGSSDWYQRIGEASDYTISMDAAMPIALWQRWWVRRYQSKFGHLPNISAAGHHYDYTRMAVRALNASGNLDLDRLVNSLYRTTYRGIWQLYRFARRPGPRAMAANEVMVGPFMEGFFFPMVQLFGGEARIVWPLKYADQPFRSPPWLESQA